MTNASGSIAFDRAAGFYDRTRSLAPEDAAALTEALVRETQATADLRILEIGIGTGRIAGPLIQRGLQVTGIDLARPMVDVLRQNHGRVPVVIGDVTYLPFADRSFDVVLAFHVLHLMPTWRDVLHEVARIVRPPGCFVHSTHWRDADSANTRLRQAWRQMLLARGVDVSRPGTRDEDQIAAVLAETGARGRQVLVAQGVETTKVRDILDRMAARIWSDTWLVPDDLFPPALAELTQWASTEFDLDAPQTEEYRLGFAVYRW
jgi:SAM-dependent methyltransferase